jgi:hypothetical protein
VQGIAAQVLAIDFLVRATLLDHEHFGAQLQNGIELVLAEVGVVLAEPVDGHWRTP